MQEIDTRDILSKLKDGLTTGLRVVNIRSKEAYDSIKIKNEIRGLRKLRSRKVFDMGGTIYRTYKHKGNVNEEIIMEKCSEIEGIENSIADWEKKLEIVHLNAKKALGSLKALSKPSVIAICECGTEIHEGTERCETCSRPVGPSVAEDIQRR